MDKILPNRKLTGDPEELAFLTLKMLGKTTDPCYWPNEWTQLQVSPMKLVSLQSSFLNVKLLLEQDL